MCEACSVRAQLGRELVRCPKDAYLLQLERMRLIDGAHNWAPKTLGAYRSRLGYINKFEAMFEVVALPKLRLSAPPFMPAIPLMWIMQHYSLQAPRGTHPVSGERISFNTSRAVCSAAAYYNEGMMVLQHPDSALRDHTAKRGHLSPGRSPTDYLGFTQMATGMSRRLGTDTTPAKALRHEHIVWNLKFRERQYRATRDPLLQYEIAAAAVTECFAYLGWLRGGEVFGADKEDVLYVSPKQGPGYGLRPGIGFLGLDLNEATKSSQDARVDVIMATQTTGGIQAGTWWLCLAAACNALGYTKGALFCQADGARWDSHYFRHQHLYPLLHLQRAAGDLTLLQCDGTPGNTIEATYYNMHVYRRAGRSQAGRGEFAFRVATPQEIQEHGRWRGHGTKDMPTRYNEWEVPERIKVTLFCQ